MPRKPSVQQTWAADVPRWCADERAVEAAIRILKLRYPVAIRPARMLHQCGKYEGLRSGAHRITLAYNMRSDRASKALWHECAHALQRERCKSQADFDDSYDAQLRAIGLGNALRYGDKPIPVRYQTIPDEREASAFEALHSILPLCAAGQPRTVYVRIRKGKLIIL